MPKNLLIEVLNGQVDLGCFCDWISGEETQDENFNSQDKTEVVLNLLNYIQEWTNKFLPTNTSSGTKLKAKDSDKPKVKLEAKNTAVDSITKVIDVSPEKRPDQRSPFKVLNKKSPTKAGAQHRCLNYGNEARRDLFQDTRSISTSTPTRGRRDSGHDQSPRTPNSCYSDYSSSPSGTKFNSTPSPLRNSPTFSPTSPTYSNNFPDLGSRQRARTPQSPCLSDFIVAKPSSQKDRKRIKPTQLLAASPNNQGSDDTRQSNSSFGTVNRPFVTMVSPVQPQMELRQTPNFEDERNLLKQKRIEVLNISAETPNKPITLLTRASSVEKSPETLVNSSLSPLESLVDPDPSLTTCVDHVVRLATIYSACLDANLVPNIITEVYLIFTLLTFSYKSNTGPSLEISMCKEQQDRSGSVGSKLQTGSDQVKCVLNSVHNCVMFAASVVDKQRELVQCLDKTVIRLLSENTRLSLFVPHIIPNLVSIAENKEAKEASGSQLKKPVVSVNGPVLYQTETDSRDNFSSDAHYLFFKKQRDIFYEILHEWRTKRDDNSWAAKKFPSKVQNLLGLSSDPVNMMHLARLFCAQLIMLNGEQSGAESELPGVPRDKLSRLQARFNKPQDSPRPPPQFPDEQQFYQQFLQLAYGFPFSVHVANCLAHHIDGLNHTDFFVESLSEEESQSQVQSCVFTCCLLAKFLGLIVFSPFQSHTSLQPDTLQAQIMVRQQASPFVDLLGYLQRALENNRLVVTVPWVVAFLGMMDPVAPHLPTYRPLLQLLVSLYRHLPLLHLSPLTSLLLRCTLGWLFDVSFFPETVFFSLVSSSSQLTTFREEPVDVDVKDIVNQALLSSVCPFLGYLRQLLLSTGASSKRASARHITPVPAHLSHTAQANVTLTLQMQLEESFLNSQPASFRATIDFVVDRVSSSCIKFICSNIITTSKDQFSNSVKKKKMNKKMVQEMVSSACEDTQAKVEAAMTDHCVSKLETVCSILLGPDASDATVRRVALDVCTRRCRGRVINWLNSHVNLSEMFNKLVLGEGSKNEPADTKVEAEPQLQPSQDKAVSHSDSAMSPPELLIQLQDILCQCVERRECWMSEQQVLDVISSVLDTVEHRSDLIVAAEHMIYSVSVDLCVVLLTYSAHLVSPQVLQQLCRLWAHAQGCEPLSRLVSARNVLLLCQGGTSQAPLAWARLSSVLVKLLKTGLLTPTQLEAQFIALFRLTWPPMVLTLMGDCLKSVLQQIKDDPICKQSPKFVLMLEWVNEMTEDLAKDEIYSEDD